MEKVIESIKNVFSIPDLKRRILFTFGILLLYRLGCHVLVPGIDKDVIGALFERSGNGILNMANMFTGGALANAAVFALGIMPYITASIILQILQKSVPYLERLAKEGEQGRNKINRYTRYLTVVFGIAHSWGISTLLLSMNGNGNEGLVNIENVVLFRLMVMSSLTTGGIVIMWLGERITEAGIGNGISLIIFASIVVAVPGSLVEIVQKLVNHQIEAPIMGLIVVVVVATVVFVVFFESGVRKITIQYAKRATASGQMAGGNSYLPFKVNSAGVIPVIFSSSIIQLPSVLTGFLGPNGGANPDDMSTPSAMILSGLQHLSYGRPLSNLVFFIATMAFTFFYVEMLFNPKDTAENLKKHGGFIPGIRPGKETQEYIENVLFRLTFWGGLYLSVVSIVPTWIMTGLQLHTLPWVGDWFSWIPPMINNGTNVTLAVTLGGTSLLIIVSVAMDFVNQVENQLIMRKYDGFTSGSKTNMARTRRYG